MEKQSVSHLPKIFITGISGFLGTNLLRELAGRYDIYGTFWSHPLNHCDVTAVKLDITDSRQLSELIAKIQPNIIIHTAAVSSPDYCEQNRDRAWQINVTSTRTLAAAAQKNNSRLVFISSDMVFDGSAGMFTESDPTGPVNYYGQTKSEGEVSCLNDCRDAVILRITLQYGCGSATTQSFSDWLINQLRAGKPANLFHDQFRSPTYAADTARGIERAALESKAGMVYHLAAPDRIDRYAFGQIVAQQYGFSPDLLIKTPMNSIPGAADRPRDVSLDGSRFTNELNFHPKGVHDGIAAMAHIHASQENP
ncbi:MAG: SDR family oxidoreductase [Deltaproteobacteria bacterium]|nr:SDR family oxidoreductase [Deltaproteobacteria bacterium]